MRPEAPRAPLARRVLRSPLFWPLVALNPDDPTVQVALATLSSGYVSDFSLSLAGAFIATVPLLVVFLVLGRGIISGIMHGTPR